MSEEETITLLAGDRSFEVSRAILQNHSPYFAAALSSGLEESRTGRFVFPDLTAKQLDLFVRCANVNFAHWPDELDKSPATPPDKYHCLAFIELEDVFRLAGLADYFTMPSLSDLCISRLVAIVQFLFLTAFDQRHHRKHKRCALRDFLFLWTSLSKSYSSSFTEVLYNLATKYPDFVLRPSSAVVANNAIHAAVFELVYSILSSDLIHVSTEDQVYDLAMAWVQAFKTPETRTVDTTIVQPFMDSIRLGLLSEPYQRGLCAVWSKLFPDYKWHNQLDYRSFESYVDSHSLGSPFFDIIHSPSPLKGFSKTRASTPCLVTLGEANGLYLKFLNLENHESRKHNLSDELLNQLFNQCFDVEDSESRLFVCHPTVESGGRAIVLFCFDPSRAQLNGFLWCMATRQAQWLPLLTLIPRTQKDSPFYSVFSNAVFRSRTLGVATLDNYVYVYFVTYVAKRIALHVFRFDFVSWSWHSYPLISIMTDAKYTTILFTPIEQISLISRDGWMYFNLELVDQIRSARDYPLRRQNLHQASHLRSHLYRFRPRTDDQLDDDDDDPIEVEHLPTPPFLIRIYRLLVVDDSSQQRQFIFPFGTCQRDENAGQYCFDVVAHKWIQWNNPRRASFVPPMRTSLCPGLLGFRGLVSVSTLDKEIADQCILANDNRFLELDGDIVSSANSVPNSNPLLFMIGRPDRTQSDQRSKPFAMYFHRPVLVTPSGLPLPPKPSRSIMQSTNPVCPLPGDILTEYFQSLLGSVVTCVNWDNVTNRTSDLFNFINDCPIPNSSLARRGASTSKRPFIEFVHSYGADSD